jgi:hypothetical protein
MTTTAPNVKFSRDIILGIQGDDVIAHKRAISRARPDFYEWQDFSNVAGPFFMDAIVKWKKSVRLDNTEKLGAVAHERLEKTHSKNHPDEWAFDPYSIKLAQDFWDNTHISPEQRVRQAIIAAGFFWHAHRLSIYYSQMRPFQMGKPPWVPDRWDCSGYVTNCYFAGGAPDPNGLGYSHMGYTGTLIAHGYHVDHVDDLKIGDLIFYGYSRGKPGFRTGDPTHVALYVGLNNGVHYVLSMGSYPMGWYPYNYRSDINRYRTYDVADL